MEYITSFLGSSRLSLKKNLILKKLITYRKIKDMDVYVCNADIYNYSVLNRPDDFDNVLNVKVYNDVLWKLTK